MSMPDFDAFLDQLEDDIVDLADAHFDELREQAVQDGEAFLDRTEADLKRWTTLLETGRLSREEMASLVRGQKDLARMNALKQAGLAAVEATRFRDALLERVVSTAVRVFL
jgi:hypothetical protein